MNRCYLVIISIFAITHLKATPQKDSLRLNHNQGLKITCHAPTSDSLVTRKKNTASIIFNGLAQAVTNAAVIIIGDDKAKQAGVLNMIGTVCHVTAQLTENENTKNQTRSGLQTPAVLSACTELTNALLKVVDHTAVVRKPMPQTITYLRSIPETTRPWVIELLLSSSTHAYQFINDLFSLAGEYLATCNDVIFSTLNDGIDDLSWGLDNQEPLNIPNFIDTKTS